MPKDKHAKQNPEKRSVLIRLRFGDDGSLGPGKVRLLEQIGELGSISAAARSMSMSYRRAWLHVDSLNRCFGAPVLIGSQGGSHGGGAELTELGRELIERFRRMEDEAEQALAAEVEALAAQIPRKSRTRKAKAQVG